MSKTLNVVICFCAMVFINRIDCIKLTKENVISLGGVNSNFENKEISEIDPLALEVINSTTLNLTKNKLTHLQEDLFQNNTKFELLLFQSNKISEIHPLVFQKLQNITIIDLQDNKLTEIHENLFEKNTKLIVIDLHQIGITFFHPNTFNGLKNLELLSASYNQLTFFDLNLLSSSKELRELYLHNNNLTEIHYHNLRSHFPKLRRASFTQNKFNCSFAKEVKDYLEKEQINLYPGGNISCISDEAYAAVVRNRYINTILDLESRQLSVRLISMQLDLDQKLDKIIKELSNELQSLKTQLLEQQSVTEKVKDDSEKALEDFDDMKNLTEGLKLQLLEQQAITDKLKSATESCCQMTF